MDLLFDMFAFDAVDKTGGTELFKQSLFVNIEKTDKLYNNREQFYQKLVEQKIVNNNASYFSFLPTSKADKFFDDNEAKKKFFIILYDLRKKNEISDISLKKLQNFYNSETSFVGKVRTFGGSKSNRKIRKTNRKNRKHHTKTLNVHR